MNPSDMEAPEFIFKGVEVDIKESETEKPIRLGIRVSPNPEREEFSIFQSLGLNFLGTLLSPDEADQIGHSLLAASRQFRSVSPSYPVQGWNFAPTPHPETGDPAIVFRFDTLSMSHQYYLDAKQAVKIFEKLRSVAQEQLDDPE